MRVKQALAAITRTNGRLAVMFPSASRAREKHERKSSAKTDVKPDDRYRTKPTQTNGRETHDKDPFGAASESGDILTLRSQ